MLGTLEEPTSIRRPFTFGLVFSVSTEHKRGPCTSHIQIWPYPPPQPHQNYYYRYRRRCVL